jgi:hypothetical protein
MKLGYESGFARKAGLLQLNRECFISEVAFSNMKYLGKLRS